MLKFMQQQEDLLTKITSLEKKRENIRLCKNYTKVTQWCGRSTQWTQ